MATQAAAKALFIGEHAVSPATLSELLEGIEPAEGFTPSLELLRDRLRDSGIDASIREIDPVMLRPSLVDERDEQAQVLLNAIGEGVCLADPIGRVLWANRFFTELDETARERISATLRSASEVFARLSVEERQDATACKFEVNCEDSGRIYEVFVTPAPPRGSEWGDLGEDASRRREAEDMAAAHGAERVAGVVRDVTSARRTAAKLDAIERAGHELIQLDTESVRARNTYGRLKLLEQKIVRLAHDVLSYDHFAIFLIDSSRDRLELVVSHGLPTEISDLDLSPERVGSGISGYVASTGEPYICRDAQGDERYLPGLPGGRSSLTVPLRLNDKIIGVMDVESRQPQAFAEEDRQFLEIFARHIAMALHMLDLLVVERTTTNISVSDRVGEEIRGPLDDIVREIDSLRDEGVCADDDRHLRQIRGDVEAIRRRLREVAEGPKSLAGVDRAGQDHTADPLLEGKRILVADDEEKIRKVIGQILTGKGAEVEVCDSGAEAIETINRSCDAPYDLVLSDIRMPDRNGYEVYAAVKSVAKSTPVILMTGFGYDPHHSIVRASQQGLAAVLFKPFEIDQMLDEVRKAVAPEDGSTDAQSDARPDDSSGHQPG